MTMYEWYSVCNGEVLLSIEQGSATFCGGGTMELHDANTAEGRTASKVGGGGVRRHRENKSAN